jgi:hypothetical protein
MVWLLHEHLDLLSLPIADGPKAPPVSNVRIEVPCISQFVFNTSSIYGALSTNRPSLLLW